MRDWIKVGAKCVCIGNFINASRYVRGEKFPIVGEKYTVRWVGFGDSGKLGIRLNEISNPSLPYLHGISELIFKISRFRPVVDERDDIAAFLAIAHKPRLDVMAEILNAAWDAERTE